MSAIETAGVIFLCTFSAALCGLWLRGVVPERHISGDSKDVVKLVVGLIATMSALVLGLLIASAKNFYDTQNAELQSLSANLVELDRVLVRYGPDANDARDVLHQDIADALERLWPAERSVFSRPNHVMTPYAAAPKAGRVYDKVEDLQPQTDRQRALHARATQLTAAAAQTRLLMLEQADQPIAWPFLTTLVCWGAFLFLGFGLLTRVNPTVIAALSIGAVALASAAFLILELSGPLYGIIQMSPEPLQAALAQMQ